MKKSRSRVLILLLLGAGIVMLLVWMKNPETRDGTNGEALRDDRNSSEVIPVRDRPDSLIPVSRSESRNSKRDVRVIANGGKGVELQVFSDGCYRLSLSEKAGDVFVPTGTEFFRTTFTDSNPVPNGVLIKIRNENGEILTGAYGSLGWYSPAIYWSVLDLVMGDEVQRDLLRADQRSVDFKLSGMLMMLQRNLKNQGELEFKLSVRPNMYSFARDAQGEPLSPEVFPEYETDWLDGDLLFVGE